MNLKDIDYTDSIKLFDFAKETIGLAEKYKESRILFSRAKRFLNLELAKAYCNETVSKGLAIEKAFLDLCKNKECRDFYEVMITEEHTYKGLEQVLKARQNAVSLAQSLCKIPNS